MDNELYEDVISAALDGEQVDIDALQRALATAEGRDAVAAFLLLRAAAADDLVVPGKSWEHLAVAARRRTERQAGVRRHVPLAWAASIAVAAMAASFWFGTTLRAPIVSTLTVAPPAAAAPPAIAPPIVVAPTDARSAQQESGRPPRVTTPPRTATEQPPAPTRVLRFVPGVDWTSAPR